MQAAIYGHAVGIIGNNGPIDPNGAAKATHFLQACDQAGTPVLFLNNTTGYMVGTETERGGMIKHGSKMIQAVANIRVPKITLYIGASYGAGNYGMCGHGYDPDFLFTWPNACTGVMGGEQAALTMDDVARSAAKRRGAELARARSAAREATRRSSTISHRSRTPSTRRAAARSRHDRSPRHASRARLRARDLLGGAPPHGPAEQLRRRTHLSARSARWTSRSTTLELDRDGDWLRSG